MDPEIPLNSQPIDESVPALPAPAAAVTTPAPSGVSTPAYKDRSTGLTIFGVFQIILGLFAALMIPFAMLGAFLSRVAPGGGMRPRQMIPGIVSYAAIAAVMITLGIGSVQKKRWARALTIVSSWYWLAIGVLVTILMTAMLPVMMRGVMAQARQNSGADVPPAFSTGIMAVVLTIIIVFMAFFLVLVPIAFLAFYSRKDVGETCRYRDPVERWTDRRPLPVLGASAVFLTGAFYMFLTGISTPLFPFFGRYLTGPAGMLCFVVLAALDVYLSAAVFRLQPAAWWLAVITFPIRLLSMALTYARADLMQAYSRVGFSEAQVQMLNSNPMFRSHVILWWSLLSVVFLFGYVLWLKRYFKTGSSPMQPSPISAQAG